MPTINGKTVSAIPGLLIKSRDKVHDAVVQFDNVNTAPTTATGKYYLYVESGVLKYNNGASSVSLGAAGGGVPSWETIFGDDSSMALTTAAWTISQAGNFGNLILTKAGTGAGVPLVINNAGTGYDLSIVNTNAEAAGIEIYSRSNWGNGTSADTVLTWSMAGNSDNGTEREFGNVKLTATDATDGSEDGTFSLDAMVAGTSRTVASLANQTLKVGYAGGIFSSNGNFDVTLQTGNASTSKIVITDGAAGDINFTMDATGVVLISTGLQVGGTTPTASIFNVAGSGGVGTTGYGFKVNATTLTTGTCLLVDSASTSSGLLLDLQLASSSVFSVSETGALIIAGVNATTSAITLTAGKLTLSDGNVAITSSSTTDVVSITDDSLLANNALIVKGSGAFTGITSSSFVAITPTALSTGTALYIAAAAATTASILADFTTSTTTGAVLRLVASGIQLDGAATGVLTMVADSATTAGATTGRGIVSLSIDALTTGTGVDITSTSLDLAAGELLNVEHIASGTLSVAKTGQLVDVTSSRTHTAATAISDNYDALSIIKTSIVNNAGGTLNTAGSALYVEVIATETLGTLADTSNGIEVVMTGTAEAQGNGIKITHTGTSVGQAIDVVASQTTATVALITANSLTTTGVGLSIVGSGTGLTSGSLLRVNSGTTGALATNGVVSVVGAGAFTSTAVTDAFAMITCVGTLTGTVAAIAATALTSGVGFYVGSTGTGITSGSLIRAVSGTTGAVASNGLLSVQATGAYSSTNNMGILAAIANTTTAGTVAYLSATSMTTGTILFLNATAASLTGKYIQCYDGAADDFSVGQYGATIIAGNASSNVLTISAGNEVITAGNLILTAGTVISTAQAILNANTAISVTHYVTKIANNGASTHTLADGVEGQLKKIVQTVYTADAVITPANLANGTTLTLNAVGDAVDLVFLGSEWWVTNLYGTAALA